ncbi:MAG: glycosyltransferase family 4 protein [Patescibacteria group bacterium]
MKIALIAPLSFPINESFAGGLESFIFSLATEQVKQGHEVTLFASANSNIPGVKLYPVSDQGLLEQDDGSLKFATNAVYANMAFTFKEMLKINFLCDQFDVIHFNSYNFLNLVMQSAQLSKKSVATFHLPVDASFIIHSKMILESEIDNINFVAISDFQKERMQGVKVVKRIHNGIDLKSFALNEKPTEKIGWLGRISPDKGIDLAIQMAIENKWSLSFAGKQHYKIFFDEKIKPFISNNIEYLGEIFGKEKSDFYGSCAVFVAPIQWDEPFGLTIIEAMACGTPVVAFKRGAMSELIVDGVTGYLVEPGDNVGFVEAVEKAKKLDRKKCRQHVENNFSIEKMVAEYLALYQTIIKENAQN